MTAAVIGRRLLLSGALGALYPPQRVMEARPVGAVGSGQPGRHLEGAEGGQVGVNGLGF